MECGDIELLVEERAGDCYNGRRSVLFHITLKNVEVPEDLYSGTLYVGTADGIPEQSPISVLYGYSPEETALWEEGDVPATRKRTYEILLEPASYAGVQLSSWQPTCPPIIPDSGSYRVSECPPPEPCPEIEFSTLDVSESCNDAGRWEISFSATAYSDEIYGTFKGRAITTNADGTTNETDFDLPNQQSALTPEDHRVFTGTHALPPGAYRIVLETNCGTSSETLSLPACNQLCPDITFPISASGVDCIDGNRVTLITVDIRDPYSGKGGPLEAQVVDSAGNIIMTSETSLTGVLQFQVSAAAPPGDQFITVNILQPEGCDSATHKFRSEPCFDPPPAECPTIASFTPIAGDCDDNTGLRPVILIATIAIPESHSGTVEATLSDETGVLETASGESGTIVLTNQSSYTAGAHTATITATSQSCDVSAAFGFNSAPCVDVPPPDSRINWCAIALIVLLVMLGVGAVMLAVGICGLSLVYYPPITALLAATGYGIVIAAAIMIVVIVIGALLLIVGNIGLLVWLVTCGTCRLNCFWVNTAVVVLDILAVFSGALGVLSLILMALGISQVCWIGWAIDTMDFVILSMIVRYFSYSVGCQAWFGVPEWARFTWPERWRFNCRIS